MSSFYQNSSRILCHLFSGHTSMTLFPSSKTSILIHRSASFFFCFLMRTFLLIFLARTSLSLPCENFCNHFGCRNAFSFLYTQSQFHSFPKKLVLGVRAGHSTSYTQKFSSFRLSLLLSFQNWPSFGCIVPLLLSPHPISLWIFFGLSHFPLILGVQQLFFPGYAQFSL